MNVKKMGLSWIIASDINNSKKFFTETLGLKLTEDNPMGWLELQGNDGGALLGIGKYCPDYNADDKPGMNAVVTMTVDNLDEAVAELKAKGVTFIGEALVIPNQLKMITFLDPDNNKFQLVEVLS